MGGDEGVIILHCLMTDYGKTMETMIWIAVLAVLVLIVVVVIKRQKSGRAPDVYVCGHCGEKDCDCAKKTK